MSDSKNKTDMPHLQVALDFVELDRAMAVARQAVAGGADYIEAGTPLIKSEGLDAVRKLRAEFPSAVIIADMKTMDAGKIEAEAAAKAGASVMTVCGAASDSTIAECVAAGQHYGLKIAVDLMGVSDIAARAAEVEALGVAWLDVHCPIDRQMQGGNVLEELRQLRSNTSLTIAVAGGINSETAAAAAAAGGDVIIVGGAITKALDPTAATADIVTVLKSGQAVESKLFRRADSSERLLELLKTLRTSNISDGWHRQSCLEGIVPLSHGQFCCGRAVTVRTLPGDWSKPVQAIDVAKPGDVIVIDACGKSPAIWGELATESAINCGVAGLVVEGAVRDTADIRRLGLPVWSRMVTTHAGDPIGSGGINIPIEICGQRICPGDWIVADDDGVMVLPAADAIEMANRGADVLEAENRVRNEIRDGNSTLAKVVNLQRWEQKGMTPDVG